MGIHLRALYTTSSHTLHPLHKQKGWTLFGLEQASLILAFAKYAKNDSFLAHFPTSNLARLIFCTSYTYTPGLLYYIEYRF